MPEIFEVKLDLIDQAEEKLLTDLQSIQEEVNRKVLEITKKFSAKGGNFVPDSLTNELVLEMRAEIKKIMARSKLMDSMSEFLTNFDDIIKLNVDQQKIMNGLKIPIKEFSKTKQFMVDRTLYSLTESNVNLNVIEPIRGILYNNVQFGGSLVKTEKALREIIVGDKTGKLGGLERWVGQMARDSIHQFDGQVNQEIKVGYGLNSTAYLGSLLKDSRPQCKRWVGMGEILDEELPGEIAWANNNGTGFNKYTDTTTFCVYRGGYNCRHSAIPKKAKK